MIGWSDLEEKEQTAIKAAAQYVADNLVGAFDEATKDYVPVVLDQILVGSLANSYAKEEGVFYRSDADIVILVESDWIPLPDPTEHKKVMRCLYTLFALAQKSLEIKRPLNFNVLSKSGCFQDKSVNPNFGVSLVNGTVYSDLKEL